MWSAAELRAKPRMMVWSAPMYWEPQARCITFVWLTGPMAVRSSPVVLSRKRLQNSNARLAERYSCRQVHSRHNIDPAGIMPQCPKCGGYLVRIHRGTFRKIAYSALFRCRQCGFRTGKFHSWLSSNYRFMFSRYTRCVRCSTYNVHRGSKRDRIDGVSRHPLSLLQHILGAPLNKCPACRLQYYDWRRPQPSAD